MLVGQCFFNLRSGQTCSNSVVTAMLILGARVRLNVCLGMKKCQIHCGRVLERHRI